MGERGFAAKTIHRKGREERGGVGGYGELCLPLPGTNHRAFGRARNRQVTFPAALALEMGLGPNRAVDTPGCRIGLG